MEGRLAALACIASALAPLPARADGIDYDLDEDDPPRWGIAMFESVIALGIQTTVYWGTSNSESVDLDLAWDWSSWEQKLTFDVVRFDSNSFGVNALWHPVQSIVQYHIGRTNNFGMLGSTALCAVQAILWEYVVEYREYPSINDLIMNSITGLQIGEPLWQIGQLWRGSVLSAHDRMKTTLFSPLDGLHDALRVKPGRWWRPRAWRSMVFEAGAERRNVNDGVSFNDAVIVGDIDIVRDRRYILPGAQSGAIKPGTWSRIRGRLSVGNPDDGAGVTSAHVKSRTAIAGTYWQNEVGDGVFAAVGTAFTYRRDRLAESWDHVAIAHIVGPQVQLLRREPSRAIRLDAAVYGDFAMIDAHVFEGTRPFLKPPPHVSSLQTHGYYPGAGLSGTARLRIDVPSWSFDSEIDVHKEWQIDGADRLDTDERGFIELATVPATAHDNSDARLYWRAQLAYRRGTYGVAGIAEGGVLRGTWMSAERTTSTYAFGLLAHLTL